MPSVYWPSRISDAKVSIGYKPKTSHSVKYSTILGETVQYLT